MIFWSSFCVELARSPRSSVGSFWVLLVPPIDQKHTAQVSLEALKQCNGSLSLYVCPAVHWRPVQGKPRLGSMPAGVGSIPPRPEVGEVVWIKE